MAGMRALEAIKGRVMQKAIGYASQMVPAAVEIAVVVNIQTFWFV